MQRWFEYCCRTFIASERLRGREAVEIMAASERSGGGPQPQIIITPSIELTSPDREREELDEATTTATSALGRDKHKKNKRRRQHITTSSSSSIVVVEDSSLRSASRGDEARSDSSNGCVVVAQQLQEQLDRDQVVDDEEVAVEARRQNNNPEEREEEEAGILRTTNDQLQDAAASASRSASLLPDEETTEEVRNFPLNFQCRSRSQGTACFLKLDNLKINEQTKVRLVRNANQDIWFDCVPNPVMQVCSTLLYGSKRLSQIPLVLRRLSKTFAF